MAKRLAPNSVMIAYLARGIRGVQDLDAEHNLTPRQVKTAIESAQRAGADISDLEEWLHNVKGVTYSVNSRKPVKAGSERIYKAGAHGDASSKTAYIKIPVTPIGAVVGSSIRVTFDEDRIVCERVK